MKVNQQATEVEMSDDFQQANFGMEFNSKIARMLSEQIYSDPILAVVREYTCNAWDAHTMVGKQEQPVLMTLPNALTPTWAVRDFGPGLSLAQVMGTKENGYSGLFNTYGKSGKDDSNDQIGGFGMGSKAGFAYVKQGSAFSITSWHEGSKHTYTAHMDTKGIPNIVLLSSEISSEPSGLLIELPVKHPDISAFLERVKKVCQYASVTPDFIGNVVTIEQPEIILTGKGWKSYKHKTSYMNESLVVMGGIAYPIDKGQFNHHEVLQYGNFLIEVPIGSIELSLSREALSYDPETIAYIKGRLDQIHNEYVLSAKAQFALLKTRWERYCFSQKSQNDRLLNGTTFSWRGKDVHLKDLRVAKKVGDATLSYFQYTHYSYSGKWKGTLNFKDAVSIIPYTRTILCWINPAKIKGSIQARYHALVNDLISKLSTVKPGGTDSIAIIFVKTSSQKTFNQVRMKLGWPDTLVKLEDIQPDLTTTVSDYTPPTDLKRTISRFNSDASSRYYSKQCVTSAEVDFGATLTTYYVPVLDGRVCTDLTYTAGTGLEYYGFVKNFKELRPNFNMTKVYCVPKQYKKHIEANANFLNLVELTVADTIAILKPKVLAQAAAHKGLTTDAAMVNFLHRYRDKLIKVADFKETKLYKETNRPKGKSEELKKKSDYYDAAVGFLTHYGTVPALPKLKLKKGVDLSVYPMLAYVKDAWSLDVDAYKAMVDYIKQCEKGI